MVGEEPCEKVIVARWRMEVEQGGDGSRLRRKERLVGRGLEVWVLLGFGVKKKQRSPTGEQCE